MNRVELFRHSNLHKFFRPIYGGRGHILVLHRVCPENKSHFHKTLQISPDYLEDVIQYYISSGIDIVSLDESHNRITAKGRVKRFVTFTFDDGYLDNLTYALPVFEKYNVPFTVFQTTGYPDAKLIFWGYLLESLVMNEKEITFTIGGKEFHYSNSTLDEKNATFYSIRKFLRDSKQIDIFPRLNAILNRNTDELLNLTEELMLSWEQIIKLSDHPLVTIGAHTVNHPILRNLTDEEVNIEIIESMQSIEKKTGNPVSYFAYPFGGINEAADREYNIAESANIKMAFTAINGNIFKHHANQLTSLPRIGLNENWSNSHIDLYINGFTPFLNKFR